MTKLLSILSMVLLFTATSALAKTFKVATLLPDGSSWMKKVRSGTREIEQQSNGRIKFKIRAGGTQGTDQVVLSKIKRGQLHGGALAAGSLTRFFPDLQVYNLPLTFASYAEVDYVRRRMDQTIIDGLRDGGMVSFHLAETGFAYLMSTKPVQSVDDVRKLRAWIPDGDPIAAELLKSFGVSPIPLHLVDVLPGLQTGLIDAVAAPPVVALALQWHNQLEYLLDVPLIYVYSAMAMDERSFAGMAEEDQRLVQASMDDVFEQIDRENRTDNQKAFDALLSQGIKVVKPGPDELAGWQDRARKSIDDLVRSGEISAGVVETLDGHLRSFRALPAGNSD